MKQKSLGKWSESLCSLPRKLVVVSSNSSGSEQDPRTSSTHHVSHSAATIDHTEGLSIVVCCDPSCLLRRSISHKEPLGSDRGS